jgi:hypothetical protein
MTKLPIETHNGVEVKPVIDEFNDCGDRWCVFLGDIDACNAAKCKKCERSDRRTVYFIHVGDDDE